MSEETTAIAIIIFAFLSYPICRVWSYYDKLEKEHYVPLLMFSAIFFFPVFWSMWAIEMSLTNGWENRKKHKAEIEREINRAMREVKCKT